MPNSRNAGPDVGPGYSTGVFQQEGPSVRSQTAPSGFTPVQADTAGFAGLASAFGQFFNLAGQAGEALDNIAHRDELRRIDAENKALAARAMTDQASGKAADPRFSNRLAYSDTYETAMARSDAAKAARDFQDLIKDKPFDGTFDARTAWEDYLKKEYGKGTTSDAYNATFLGETKRQIEPLLEAHHKAVLSTVWKNDLASANSDVAATLSNPERPYETPDFQGQLDNYKRLYKGDETQAFMALTSALYGAAQNPSQVGAVIKAVENSGYAEKHPDVYLELQDKLVKGLDETRNTEAQRGYFLIRQTLDNSLSSGQVSLDDLHVLKFQADETFGKFGGKREYESTTRLIDSAITAAAKKKAEFNSLLYSIQNKTDHAAVAAKLGKSHTELMNAHWDPLFTQMVAQGNYPALQAATRPDGTTDILATPEAAREAGAIVGGQDMQYGLMGDLPQAIKLRVGRALTQANDPAEASNAVRFLMTLEGLQKPEVLQRNLEKPELDAYLLAKYAAGATGRFEEHFRQVLADPQKAADLAAVRNGHAPWSSTLLFQGQTDNVKAQNQVDDAINKALLASTGRAAGLFGRNPGVHVGMDDMADLRADVLGFIRQAEKVTGRAADLDKVVETLGARIRGRYLALPGVGNSFQIVKADPSGRGLSAAAPLSQDPTTGRGIYAPGVVAYPDGTSEDTVATMRDDLEKLAHNLPGYVKGTDKFYLDTGDLKADGLYRLHNAATGEPLVMRVGDKVSIPGTVKAPPVAVLGAGVRLAPSGGQPVDEQTPTDPAAWRKYVQAKLPPGFYLSDPMKRWDPTAGKEVVTYSLAYGFRLTKDPKDRAAELKSRQDGFAPPDPNAGRYYSVPHPLPH